MIRATIAFLIALAAFPVSGFAEALDILIEEKAREMFGVTMPDAGEFSITFQNGIEREAVMLSDFWMDQSTGQFVANAVLAQGEVRRVVGLATLNVPVPVPVRRILPDSILTEADLQVVQLPYGRVGAFVVTDADELVGKQVRRVLSQGRPVMAQAVMRPLIIDRGDLVDIILRDGPLELTAPGRALTDAYQGQELKIVNLVSNTTVIATATADGIVEVRN